MSQLARVAITGMGVFCPIGCERAVILTALREGRGGIGPITRFESSGLYGQVAGETNPISVAASLSEVEEQTLDWTAQMAVAAARQAWLSAVINPGTYAPQRIGLSVGGSGAGLNGTSTDDLFRLRFQPQEQATAIVSALGIGGPAVTFTSASAASGLAVAHAISLLRSGRCDVVVAGGAEALSEISHISMDTMRLCSPGPCSPFSGEAGLTSGEGSAFFILERLQDAMARGAVSCIELYSFGATQDAYDVVSGDPSGDGLVRAFTAALEAAALPPMAIDWIKANGTSNREQDSAETLAIKQVFDPAPPVSATESFVGHANGAAPAIGLGLALIAFEDHLIPPTINFSTARAGCDLDYVPNQSRASKASCVLASSIGFGGSNVALIFGKPGLAPLNSIADPGLCITGIGIVSPYGIGHAAFIQGLREGNSAIRSAPRLQSTADQQPCAGLIEDLGSQRFSNKLTLLQCFALLASTEAWAQACIGPEHFEAQRFGLFVGLTRSSAAARSQYAAAIADGFKRQTTGRLLLRMGRFTVASALSQHFKLKGYGATISEGFGAGLHALAHACIHMQTSAAETAMMVVAGDEIGPGTLASLAELKWLGRGHDGCFLRPYDAESSGTTLAEGAVALVLERTSFAEKRGAKIQAHIDGIGLRTGNNNLADAILEALAGRRDSRPISAAYGNGCGIWQQDQAELSALRSTLPPQTPLSCVNAGLGFAEGASGLFHVAAAAHALTAGEIFPVAGRASTAGDRLSSGPMLRGAFSPQLVTATTERNRHAAVVLRK